MATVKVERKQHNDNPFYGMRNTMLLFQEAGKGNVNNSILAKAWEESQATKEKRQLFFSLLFSVGDITARQHNLFKGKQKDNGGFSHREAFRVILQWMITNHFNQFSKFLFNHIITEYTTFDNLYAFRVQTMPKKARVQKIVSLFNSMTEKNTALLIEVLSEYAANIIKGGSDEQKRMLAKFLTRPRLTKRKGHKKILPATLTLMKAKAAFIDMVSTKAGLEVQQREKYIDFTGYYNWRKTYIQEGVNMLESYAFSSGKVKELDQEEFYAWLEAMPASARFRVRKRLLNKDNTVKPKWGDNLPAWFLNWEKFKENKQAEQRVLEEKVRQGVAEEKDVEKLKKVKQEAKVTVGAVNFQDIFGEIIMGDVDELKLQPFLDKINLPYNTLVFIDDSYSMSSNYMKAGKTTVSAFDFATFMATIALAKNPEDTGRSLLGFFSNTARIASSITGYGRRTNKLMRVETHTVNLPLYNPEIKFLENLHNIRAFATANQTGNGTNISSIPMYLHSWAKDDREKIEQLMEFPVWTIITDGNWNNMYSPEASINDFMMQCERYFGFTPYIVAIDASMNAPQITRFSGINNFMMVPPNPAAIEQYLVNFKDFDIADIYLPLLSLYRSNRYEAVRNSTL